MYSKITWDDLDLNYLDRLIALAKEEDLASLGQKAVGKYKGDLTSSLIPENSTLNCELVARKDLTVSGLQLIERILNAYQNNKTQTKVSLLAKDGEQKPKGSTLARIEGSTQVILAAERVILNFIQKLSGIATLTQTYVQALNTNSKIKLCDTRKTTPGYRMLEKYAVSCGGAYNHRLGLNHWLMFKDNHLSALGLENLNLLAKKFRANHPDVPIEIEVDSLEQLETVLKINPEIILLDNFLLPDILTASNQIRSFNSNILIEVSGNVSLQTLPELAKLPIDIISTGAITHQSTWVDIGLDWKK
jgi:nicotinate-nucleotide pyrophosphorylase (carboxylating)